MKRKLNNNIFPPEKELKRVREKLSDPNFEGGSLALPKNASLLEQTKYNLCEKILGYKQKHKLTCQKLAKQIQLSIPETEDILHYRITKFTLDRLISYAERLTLSLQINIFQEKPSRNNFARLKSTNNRLRKHL